MGSISARVSSNSATVFRPDGKSYYFTWVAGVWTPDADIRDRLERLADGAGVTTGWRLTTGDDVVETYNRDGQPILFEYRSGLTLSLVYTNALLTSVQSNAGESLTFVYDTYSRLRSLAGPGGRTWQYQYSSLDLLGSVVNPDGTTRTYHYNEQSLTSGASLTAALTGITDERGIRYASFGYDTQARAIMSKHAGNAQQVTIDYDPDPALYPAGTRIVTNSRGEASVYSTAVQLGVHLVTGVTGPGCLTCGTGDTAYNYDPTTNNLLSKTEHGVTTEYGNYDSNGNPGYRIEAEGTSEERRFDYTYDARFTRRVQTVTEPSVYAGGNKVTSYTYDDYGNRTNMTVSGFTPAGNPVSRSTSWQFNGPLNQLSLIDGPRTDSDDITLLRYYINDVSEGNNRARLKEVEDATGALIRSNIQYTDTGKIASELRPNGLGITYTYYPGNDRLETMIEAGLEGSHVTRWTYLVTGEVQSITVADGTTAATTISFQYDDARRLMRVSDGLGGYIEYTLDAEGNRTAENVHDAAGTLKKSLAQSFDSYNRPGISLSGVGPTGSLEQVGYQYSSDGTLGTQVDGEGSVTSYTYDALKRLLRMSRDTEGSQAMTSDTATLYSYDVSDRVTSVTDPNANTTSYQYDDLDNLLVADSPDTGVTIYTYDGAGNTSTLRNSKKQRYSYTYDALNRITFSDAPRRLSDITYMYDFCEGGSGHLCSVSIQDSVIDYSYDSFGNIVGHQSVAYSYDDADRIRTITYPSGAVVSYIRDAAGEITGIDLTRDDVTEAILFNITHAPFGSVESMAYGNGKRLEQAFDSAYRMESQYIMGVQDLAYAAYDGNGNLEMRTNQLTAVTDYFAYDALDRLAAANDAEYSYDSNGNRTQLTNNIAVTDYGYVAASNRLVQAGTESVLIDGAGNILQQGNRKYRYWPNNRLSTVLENDILVASYVYNGLGQRQSKRLDKSFTGFSYGLSGELLVEQNPVDGISKEYIYLDGQPVAILDVRGSVANGARLTVTTTPALIQGEISMDWSGIQLPTSTDWVGVYELGAPDSGYLDWEYTDGSPAGTVSLVLDHPRLVAGKMYEMRLYANDGYVRLATSTPFKLNPDTPAVIFSSVQAVLNQGISVSWSGIITPTPTDWVGVYKLGAPGQGYLDWVYTNGASDGSATILLTDQQMVVGQRYELRLYPADQIMALYAVSVPFILEESVIDISSSKLFYIHNDHLGTPQVMTDKEGSVVWQASYDPFGRVTVDPSSVVEMNVRFPGQYFDAETGCHYNYSRYYCPDIGRYLTADPIGLRAGPNPYTYVYNNPTGYIDPDGLEPYLVSRRLAFTSLASHNFVVSNADYIGDPNATIHSFGMNNFGKTGRVDQNTRGFSDTTSIDDANFWRGLSTSSCSVTNSNTTRIPAFDAMVDQYSKYLIENTDYAAFAGIFGTNSNSAASALANISAGVPVPIPGPSYRLSPGAGNANQIQFSRP